MYSTILRHPSTVSVPNRFHEIIIHHIIKEPKISLFESHPQDPGQNGRTDDEGTRIDRIVPGGTLYLSEEDKVLTEQAMKRVLEDTQGQNITQTEIRRRQIWELLNSGLKPARVAATVDCSADVIYKIIKLKKMGESLAPKPKTGRPRIRNKEFVAKLNALREANPSMSNAAMAKKFGVSSTTVERAVKEEQEKASNMNIS